MKVLTLKIGDKTYTTGKIITFLSKEALKIQKDTISFSRQCSSAGADLEAAEALFSKMIELKERRTWLICEVYGNKFTAEELEKNFDDDELNTEVNRIILGVAGVIEKN